MAYKWKPSISQRQAFAKKMQTPIESIAYEIRKLEKVNKIEKANKRRMGSEYNYRSSGGNFTPTKKQHDFCFYHSELFTKSNLLKAANLVMYGYSWGEKIHHDNIHAVNEVMRSHNYL
jgi:hypothetical protein